MTTYSITLERGTDGTYLAWVDELPGCAVRAASRAEVIVWHELLHLRAIEFARDANWSK